MGLCDGFMYVILYSMYLQTTAIYNKTIDKINIYDVSLLKNLMCWRILILSLYEKPTTEQSLLEIVSFCDWKCLIPAFKDF